MRNVSSRFLGAAVVAVLSIVAPNSAGRADDLAELARLVQAESEQYVTLRNTLLDQHPGPWDIPTAAAHAWDFGLAAYILNQRLKEKEAFKTLDNQHPRSYRSVNGYGKLTGSQEANTAFLLEKMWKAPGEQEDRRWAAPPEKDRQYAYNTLVQGRRPARVGETALWKSMWQDCEDDQYRFIALRPLCADPDRSVQPIILEVLHHPDPAAPAYAKSRCLGGLVYRDTEETVEAILGAFDVLRRERRLSDAVGALAVNGSPRARRFVHEFILNPENDETLRGEALAKCCNRPHPDDVEIIRQFMAGPASVRVKTRALSSIGSHCPFKHVRLVFREILIQSDDREMIASAASALNSAYGLTKHADPSAKSDDAALLESVLQRRDDLGNATRVHIQMYIDSLRAKPGDPRPELPGPPPQNR